jgi:hypothetical protein
MLVNEKKFPLPEIFVSYSALVKPTRIGNFISCKIHKFSALFTILRLENEYPDLT